MRLWQRRHLFALLFLHLPSQSERAETKPRAAKPMTFDEGHCLRRHQHLVRPSLILVERQTAALAVSLIDFSIRPTGQSVGAEQCSLRGIYPTLPHILTMCSFVFFPLRRITFNLHLLFLYIRLLINQSLWWTRGWMVSLKLNSSNGSPCAFLNVTANFCVHMYWATNLSICLWFLI